MRIRVRANLAPTVLVALVLLTVSASVSQAVGPGTAPVAPPSGGFAIEGNLQANVPTAGVGDWLPGPSGSGGNVLNAAGVPLVPATTYHFVDLQNNASDDNFNGGLKFDDNPNSWTWVANPVNNKTDMNNGLIHLTRGANGHIWIVIAADRRSNNGDAYIDFEFLQNTLSVTGTPGVGGGFASSGPNGGRTVNDFILTLSLTQGGSTAGFAVDRWESVGGGLFDYVDRTASLPAGAAFGAVNTASVPVSYGAFGGSTYAANTFVEGAVDLTALLGAFDPCLSLGVKTILIKSKTSQSPTATITDFITPLQTVLQLGVANAGPDQSICSQGASTMFSLNGTATPAPGDVVSSTTWSKVSGNVTIADPSSLATTATVVGDSATLRLTVVTSPHGCSTTDEVTLRALPLLPCSVTGPDGPLCPGSGPYSYCAPAGLGSYQWSISGAGTIQGSATGSCVNVQTTGACNDAFTLSVAVSGNACPTSCSKTVQVLDQGGPTISALPGPTTIECPATPSFATPTASDGCDPSPTLTFADVTTPGSCPQAYSVTRTWTAQDHCGHSTTASQTIDVADTHAPTISALPAPTTIECPATPSFATPTATDACDPSPTLTFVDATTPGSCPQAYSVTRTWTAEDHCGHSSTASQTIDVADTHAPTISALPARSTVECPGTPEFATPTATDACDPDPTLTFVDVTTPGSCPQASVVTRTWTARDHCGNASTSSQTIDVVDTHAPSISELPGPATIECPAFPSFTTPTATDACDPSPTLTFVDVTTPGSCPQAYSVTRTWTAQDHCGNSSTASQSIAVVDTHAPTISELPGPATIECPASPSFTTPTATDACDPNPTLTFADVTTPGSCPQVYSVTRTWTARDHCGNQATASQTIGVADTHAPTFSALPSPTTVECPATPSFALATVTDACDPNPMLTFDDQVTPGSCPQSYTMTRIWTATDHCGNQSTATQRINVADTHAPVISALPGPTTIECPATPSFATPTATDACDPSPTLTFVDVTMPGSCAQAYSVTRTWTAKDHCRNSSTKSQTINVVDTHAPTISALPGPATIECPATPSFATPTATDACDPNPTLTFADVTTPGSCPQAYSVTRTWTAQDHCGNASTKSQSITVVDTHAPTISALPGPTTIECPATPSFATPTATDACDPSPTLTFTEVTTPGSCPQAYAVTRTWTARDHCGNQSTASQSVTVVDTHPPTLSELPGPTTIECPATPSFTTPTATDACDPGPTLTFADVTTPGSCPQAYSVTRTWTAKDHCGNSSTAGQSITVVDTHPPTISELPGPTVLECPASPSFATPTATDACDPNPTLTFADVTTPGSCPQAYSVTRTWTAMDHCGNQVTASQTIGVADTHAPAITCSPDITVGSCANVVNYSTTATDACDPNPTLTCSPPSGSTFPVGTTTVTCTAVDHCGNQAQCTFKVTVQDAPVCGIEGPNVVCEGSTVQLCGPEGAASWTWTGPGDFNASTRCVDVGTAGRYSLRTTDAKGCQSTCTRDLTVNPRPECSISGTPGFAAGGSTQLCGPQGAYAWLWNTGATSRCITVNTPGTYSLTVTDLLTHCVSQPCSVLVNQLNCACSASYPDNSNLPRSGVAFNESEVLRAFSPGTTECVPAGATIKLWYNDEHALTLGVRRVVVKTASGTTTTDYPITPTPASPTCVAGPLMGATAPSGDQSGNDVAAGDGRPLWPALFVTDLTVNGVNGRIGDWQQGGTGVPPHRVCGTWKAAVRTVDKTANPPTVTVTPDSDPAKNDWTLGAGADVPPGGFASLADEGYGAECIWNVDQLGLVPGHSYRLYFMVHDGDQNKIGGDSGQGCTTALIAQSVDVPPVSEGEGRPTSFALMQNVPNPFRMSTRIRFALPEASEVHIGVYTILGEEVARLVDGTVDAGYHSAQWNATDRSGRALPPGLYVYRMQAHGVRSGEFFQSRKMILLK